MTSSWFRRLGVALAAFALAPALSACGAEKALPLANSLSDRPVVLPSSEVRTLASSSTGRSYDLYISYPEGYPGTGASKYPVVYLLDAQWDFKLLQAIYEDQEYDKRIPPLLIVGITHAGTDPDYGALRARDYTPVPAEGVPGSGDGPAFLRFLRTELIPYVESGFRADPARRVIMGSSYGGLFALYSMLTDPGLFYGYVAASPAVMFGKAAVVRQAEAYAARHDDLPVRLWIGVGGTEPLRPAVRSFWESLTARRYPGLDLRTRELDDEGHSGSKPEAYSRGLRFVFSP
ncbi:MAG: hypothetical protein QG622_330 [Actinomycetota bacterium]|nr:hypothetical protein [Actinomycetota bacterium]